MDYKLLYALMLLLQLTLGQIICTTGQVFVKFRVKTTSYGSEQSFIVSQGGSAIYTSPALADAETRVIDACITSSTNNQYSIELKDSYGDSWSNGSWLEVMGLYGNIVFKNFLVTPRTQTFPLSLYYGIMKSQSWKMSVIASEGWTALSFSDSSWTDIVLQTTTTSVTGTQYFRRQFFGLPNMASFEARFRYRYGIVAYINGVEIYRDNMPTGAVQSSTPASGGYESVDFRGLLHSALHVSATQSVLAVEIHFLVATSDNNVDFDAFLAINAPSIEDQLCSIVPTSVSISNPSSISNVGSAFDFDKGSNMYSTISTTPVIINYNFDSIVRPVVNGIHTWPSSSPSSQAKAFTLGGSHDATSTVSFNNIIDTRGQLYESQKFKQVFGHFNIGHFKHYRLTITQGLSNTLYLYEIMPIVCNIPSPTSITFEKQSYSYFVHYQSVVINSIIGGLSGCSISPALPAGIILDPITCYVSGIATAVSAPITYTVTSANPIVISGSFTLTTTDCTGTMFAFKRVYKDYASNEGFKVLDASNDNSLLTVAVNSGQENGMETTYFVCVSVPRIKVQIEDTLLTWNFNSFLYVNVMLDSITSLTLGRVRKDTYLGLPLSYFYNSQLPIQSKQVWYYKMGDVPATWTDSSTDGWTTASVGTFPVSTNKIQLYKKSFTITSLDNVAGFVLSIKFKYGCVVFINGVEVYRLGVDGAVSTTSEASNSYNEVIYRGISLPTKTMLIGDVPSVSYLQAGQNTIAIALVALTNTQTASVFDCALSLMGDNEVNRVFDYTATQSGAFSFDYALNDFSSNQYYSNTCTDNTGTIIFNDDRHEWISSVVLQTYYYSLSYLFASFILEAHNPEDAEWTLMKTVTDQTWSLKGQTRRFWLLNNKPYNQWRLRNIATGKPASCSWYLNRLHFESNSMTRVAPTLAYENTSVYKDIEMSEVYPSSDLYTDFTIQPALPPGITMETNTGMIYGTATAETSSITYSVQARKISGGSVSCTFTFVVSVCYGGKALMTMRIHVDSYPSETSYRLYSGRGTTSQPIATNGALPLANSIYYLDRCLLDGIYTFEAQDSYGDGWDTPAGYALSIDSGEMLYDMNMVFARSGTVVKVTTVFSSVIPFQIEHTPDWKAYTDSASVSADWKTMSFNDGSWKTTKAAVIGLSQATTVYIRKAFNIPNLDDYQVLNVRMTFTGGAVVYFNGNKVARFNLDREFDESTPGGPARSADIFVKFHIILPTTGAIVGNNVMAVELHRAEGGSSSDIIVFDATGVFGVQECSPLLDSYTSVTSSPTIDGTIAANAFSMWAVNFLKLENTATTQLTWTVDNLEGSRFNNYGIIGDTVNTLSFTLLARDQDSEQWLEINEHPSQSLVSRVQKNYESPVSLIGFRQLRWRQNAIASNVFSIFNFFINYCKTSGAVCPGSEGYPSVTEGQISPATCAYGYRGYSSRLCTAGVLGPIDNTKCEYRIPERLRYAGRFEFVMDTSVETKAPTVDYIVTRFYADESSPLPEGLHVDGKNGIIRGIPTKEDKSQGVYTIRAENPSGSTFTTVTILVRKGACNTEGVFVKTTVGSVAIHDCASQGSYVGSQKRACVLGVKDGEWQKATGFCMSIATIVILVVVVIVVVAVIVFILVRATSKTKAVGGVKGRKSSKGSAAVKKQSAKNVKV